MAYPVSSRWDLFVRRGMHPITRVNVRIPGQGVVLSDLTIEGGSISVDRTTLVRRSGSLVVPAPELSPIIDRTSVLSPHGAELEIFAGIRYPDGIEELIPLGVFPVWKASSSERAGNVPTIALYDRMKLLERDDRESPKDFGGQLIQSVIEEVALHAAPFYPGDAVEWIVTIHPSIENFRLPRATIMEGSPAEFLGELADSLGADIYFDREGNLRVDPVPGLYVGDVPDITPDWIFDAGQNGVLIDASREVSREGVFNGVKVTGNGDGDRPVPSAFVVDNDPNSPTYFGGQFGKAVKKVEDGNLTTNARCLKAARAILRNSTGLQEPLDFTVVGSAAVDVGDICEIRFLDGGTRTAMVDNYSFNLTTTELSGTTRAIQYISEDD